MRLFLVHAGAILWTAAFRPYLASAGVAKGAIERTQYVMGDPVQNDTGKPSGITHSSPMRYDLDHSGGINDNLDSRQLQSKRFDTKTRSKPASMSKPKPTNREKIQVQKLKKSRRRRNPVIRLRDDINFIRNNSHKCNGEDTSCDEKALEQGSLFQLRVYEEHFSLNAEPMRIVTALKDPDGEVDGTVPKVTSWLRSSKPHRHETSNSLESDARVGLSYFPSSFETMPFWLSLCFFGISVSAIAAMVLNERDRQERPTRVGGKRHSLPTPNMQRFTSDQSTLSIATLDERDRQERPTRVRGKRHSLPTPNMQRFTCDQSTSTIDCKETI